MMHELRPLNKQIKPVELLTMRQFFVKKRVRCILSVCCLDWCLLFALCVSIRLCGGFEW